MNRIWIGIIAIGVFILVVILGGLFYIYSGSYNVAGTEDLASLSQWVFSTTTMKSIQAHAESEESPLPNQIPPHMLQEGAEHYGEMCAGCHGAPGVKPAWLAKGMTPSPPDLEEAAEEFSDGELFWIVKHGIKHSGMPAMAPTHGKQEIQEVVGFVKNLPDMSPQQYELMGGGHSGGGHEHEGEHAAATSTANPRPQAADEH